MRTMECIIQRLRLPLTLALVATLGILCPVPASAADTLDQSQPVSQSPTTVSSSVPKAQIFNAGMYGQLDRVSLYLENYSASPPAGAVLTVSVQTVIGGLPSGKQIGSGAIPLSAIPPLGNPGWVDVRVGGGAIVEAGTQYALVLQTSNLFGSSVNWWFAYQGYAGGAMAFNDGIAWRIDENFDFAFQTYVVPDALDQSQTTINWAYDARTSVGQTFTAGLSGVLDRVSVPLGRGMLTRGTLAVTIQTVNGGPPVNGGSPPGTVIGQGSISFNSIPWHVGWVTVAIRGAVVTAGTQYTLVIHSESGESFDWGYAYPEHPYSGGHMVIEEWGYWYAAVGYWGESWIYAGFATYVFPPVAFAPPPPPPLTNTPCSSGVCPAVSGSITPPDSTARITSNAVFQELPDGRVHGILIFDDSKTGNFVLQGCTTDSAACRLTVKTFACTDQHAITVAGTYTPKGETERYYRLTLSGARGGIGTFTLSADDYTYTLTRNGIVDVTCPPVP
jgi:hypothetical protein